MFALLFTTLGTGAWTSPVAAAQPELPKRIEIEQYRDEVTKVYANPDGTLTAEVSLEPVHFKKDGKWVDMDNTLISNTDGSLENKSNKFKVKFPQNTKEKDRTRLLDYAIDGHEISLGLANGQGSSNKVFSNPANAIRKQEQGKVSYSELYPGVKFEYSVNGSKVKENIILDSYQGKNTFEFLITASGLTANKLEDGSIEFKEEATGKYLFTIVKPFMFDSNTEANPDGTLSMKVDQEISAVKGGFKLTVTADETFLTDPSTVYPVTIDPNIDYFDSEDTYVAYNYPSTLYYNNQYLYVGHDGTIGATRSYVKWPSLPSLPEMKIVEAVIDLEQYQTYEQVANVDVHQVLSAYNTNTLSWSNQPSFSSTVLSSVGSLNLGDVYFDVTDLVKGWYAGTPNYGVVFKNAIENTNYNRRSFRSSEWNNPNGTLGGKPRLVITLLPNELTGITDYWQYTPDLFYGTGTGIVNVFNGNLVYKIPLLDLKSRADAFKVEMTYNSRNYSDDGYGWGWTLSAQRRLIINNQKNIIQYVDPTGARYIFPKTWLDSSTSYTSPEGTYFQMNSTAQGYTIKQPDDTILYFDTLGRNYKIQDEKGNIVNYVFNGSTNEITEIQERHTTESVGRTIKFSAPRYGYNANGVYQKSIDITGLDASEVTTLTFNQINGTFVLDSITYPYATSEEKKVIRFGYDSNTRLLNGVYDGNGNLTSVIYDGSNRVAKVSKPQSSSVFSVLSYPSANQTDFTDVNNKKTIYLNNYNPRRALINVTEVKEEIASNQFSITKYNWDNNRLIQVIEANGTDHNITYEQNSPTKIKQISTPTGNLKLENRYYDNFKLKQLLTNGGSIDDLIYDANGNIVSSSNNYRLTDTSTYDKYGNNLTSTTPTRVTFNRLQNSNFEYLENNQPAKWIRRAYGAYNLDDRHVVGKKSGRLYLSATDGAGYYTQTVSVDPDESEKGYTVSAYVKTDRVLSGVGASLRVYPLDANGNYLYDNGNVIKYESPTITGKDWTRISNYFTAPSTAAKIKVDLLFTGAGEVFFDGAQLVYGKMLDNYYANENGSMEWGTPDTWTLNNLSTGDGKSTEQKKRGNASFKINGTTLNKYVGQYVEVDGTAGTPLTLSGWAYATGTNPNGGDFALRVVVMHNDGTERLETFQFNKSLTNQWQMVKTTLRPTKDFNRIKVYGLYYNQTGTVYYDNFKLEEMGSVSSTVYDSTSYGNFIESQTDELNNTTRYVNDKNGNVTSQTDASGKISTFVYDKLNRIKQATLKGSSNGDITVDYLYDKQGNLKQRQDPLGRITTFTPNELNKTMAETDPLGKSTEYQYDDKGNVLSVKQTQGGTVVSTIEYKNYDYKDRPQEKWVNGKKEYVYQYLKDDLDKVEVFAENGTSLGFYDLSYDGNHRLDISAEPDGYKLDNDYSTATGATNGMRTQYTETVFGQPIISRFDYDNLQRLYQIVNPQSVASKFFYNERGAIVRISNGETTPVDIYQDYDDAGRLTNQYLTGLNLDLRYAYDANGQLQSYTTTGSSTQAFEYDGAKRLTKWTNNGVITSYVYDLAGNLINPHGKTLNFNEANEIIGFTYDGAGNLLQDTQYNYEWNGEGQLTKVTKPDGSLTVTYTYDPNGLRKTKTVTNTGGTKTYKYYYDGTNLIRVTDGTKTLWTYTWANNKPVSMTDENGFTYYLMTNYRGDVVKIVGTSGAEAASYTYDPWGKLLSNEPTGKLANQPLRYASYVYDTETALYYLQARYYDSDTARFISRDPDGGDKTNPLSQNLYAYANADPVNNVDPDGRWAVDVMWLSVDAAAFVTNPTLGGLAWIGADLLAFLDPTGVFSTAAHAAKAGKLVGKYNTIKRLVKGSGLEVHHLIEKRLAFALGVSANSIPSVALSHLEHLTYTNRWRKAVPYGTGKIDRGELRSALRDVYGDSRELRAASLKWLRNVPRW